MRISVIIESNVKKITLGFTIINYVELGWSNTSYKIRSNALSAS